MGSSDDEPEETAVGWVGAQLHLIPRTRNLPPGGFYKHFFGDKMWPFGKRSNR